MKNRAPIIAAGVVLLLAAWHFIPKLIQGGFNEVVVEEKTGTSYTLHGFKFKGRMIKSEAFARSFETIEKLIHEKGVDSYACAYYFNTPRGDQKDGEAFVGALVKDQPFVLTDTFETKTFTFERSLMGSQRSKMVVSKVEMELWSHAKETGLQLDSSVLMERYVLMDSLQMEIPIVKP